MVNDFIYSPNSRLTKFRQACNLLNAKFHAKSGRWNNHPIVHVTTSLEDSVGIGYIYYDTDLNTSAGFIFATRDDYSPRVQNFKQVCFSSHIRLFHIGVWTYYRVDATGLLHGNNKVIEHVCGRDYTKSFYI